MNDLLKRLQGGSLISDGNANEVAGRVLEDPSLLPILAEGLRETDEVVRARTAHSLERISRRKPEIVERLVPELVKLALTDPVPMVRWHIPMIFASIDVWGESEREVFSTLFRLLADKSVFVKSWTVAALVVLARKREVWREETLLRLEALTRDPSVSVRSRAAKAVDILRYNRPLPTGWYKGQN